MKRILLLVATNFLIMLMLAAALATLQVVFGFRMPAQGAYMVMAVVFGFGGAIVSLLMSRQIAKWTTGAKVIESPVGLDQIWLMDSVKRIAAHAGVPTPQVAIYEAAEVNAFATGPSKSRSLVAVSSGLFAGLSRPEGEAVLAHEISHIANGDMVTMTLAQGTLNTFVMIAGRAVGMLIDRSMGGRDSGGGGIGYFFGVIIGQLVFGLLASILVMAFSRYRELRADRGGASLTSKSQMIAALRRLEGAGEASTLPPAVHAFGFQGGATGLMAKLFRSHPPLEERIAALEKL
jgi:heat shock protein HtpX